MRLLHTSDWHLGRTFHGASLQREQAAVIDAIVDLTVAAQVDVGGDQRGGGVHAASACSGCSASPSPPKSSACDSKTSFRPERCTLQKRCTHKGTP